MSEEYELRTISADAVPNAIAKAKQYRLLNQPAEPQKARLSNHEQCDEI